MQRMPRRGVVSPNESRHRHGRFVYSVPARQRRERPAKAWSGSQRFSGLVGRVKARQSNQGLVRQGCVAREWVKGRINRLALALSTQQINCPYRPTQRRKPTPRSPTESGLYD